MQKRIFKVRKLSVGNNSTGGKHILKSLLSSEEEELKYI